MIPRYLKCLCKFTKSLLCCSELEIEKLGQKLTSAWTDIGPVKTVQELSSIGNARDESSCIWYGDTSYSWHELAVLLEVVEVKELANDLP